MFDYIENTKCLINGKEELIRLGKGCTGIGSRTFWINNKGQADNLINLSDDITKGNHFIYFGYWGERPWDSCYFLVPESEAELFLEQIRGQNVYKQPEKRFVKNNSLVRG